MDFLMNTFETFKCSRCRKTYRRISFDTTVKTCPPCLNGKDEDGTQQSSSKDKA